MKKQVGTRKYVLLSLNSYNDLLIRKNSSADDIPGSQVKQAKNEILGASCSVNQSDSEALAKLNVSSELFKNSNTNNDFSLCLSPQEKDQTNASSQATESLAEQNKFLPVHAVDKVLDALLESGMSSGKIERSKRILNIFNQKHFTLDTVTGVIQGKDGLKSTINLLEFLIAIQSPNKKLASEDLEIISKLKLPPHLVANTFAKRVTKATAATSHRETSNQFSAGASPTWLSIF